MESHEKKSVRYHSRSPWNVFVDKICVGVKQTGTSVGGRSVHGRGTNRSIVIQRSGVEGVSAAPMGNIEFFGIHIVPAGLFIRSFKYSLWRRSTCFAAGTWAGSDNLPFALGSLKDRYLLSIMTDPDQVFRVAGVSFYIYESELPLFGVFSGSINALTVNMLDGPYPIGQEKIMILLLEFLGFNLKHSGGRIRQNRLSTFLKISQHFELVGSVRFQIFQGVCPVPGGS